MTLYLLDQVFIGKESRVERSVRFSTGVVGRLHRLNQHFRFCCAVLFKGCGVVTKSPVKEAVPDLNAVYKAGSCN